MLEVLQFIFSSFWIWLGFFILLLLIVSGLTEIVGTIFQSIFKCIYVTRETKEKGE
jgi:hypothetical protein